MMDLKMEYLILHASKKSCHTLAKLIDALLVRIFFLQHVYIVFKINERCDNIDFFLQF